MKISVLGTSMVGEALASKLASLGHDVMMGARSKTNEKATDWAAANGVNASHGDFTEAADFGDVVIFATLGSALLDAADLAGAEILAGKVVVDVTNPLQFGGSGLPSLIPEFSNTTSAGEELQKRIPDAKVVKTLNTMNCHVMVDPGHVSGAHDVFLCGDDDGAKATVVELLNSFGWAGPIDLGPLSAARGTEAMMLFWLPLWSVIGSADFNYRIVRNA